MISAHWPAGQEPCVPFGVEVRDRLRRELGSAGRRAEEEARRAEAYAKKLRDLGIDPDDL